MIAEFELLYHLLDLPGEVTASAVRDAFKQRVATLEAQESAAGSKTERRMAAKALADVTCHANDVERLAAALEFTGFLDEAKSGLAERKAAKTKRALANARAAAEKSALQALLDAAAETEDAFADSGIARDAALDAELDELETGLAAREAIVTAAVSSGGPVPTEIGPALDSLEAKRSTLYARAGSRGDPETRARLESVAARLAACIGRVAKWNAEREMAGALTHLRDRRLQLEKSCDATAAEQMTPDALRHAIAEIEAVLAESLPPAVATKAEIATERNGLSQMRDRLQVTLPRCELRLAIAALEKEAAAGSFAGDSSPRIARLEAQVNSPTGADFAERVARIRIAYDAWAKPPPVARPPPPPVARPPPPPAARTPPPPPATPATKTPPVPPPPAPDQLSGDETIRLPRPHQGTVLRLTPKAVPAGVAARPPIHFVARPIFKFGRNRKAVDFPTHLLPYTPENDQITKRISRVHCHLKALGGKVTLVDGDTGEPSANLTYLDQANIAGSVEVGLDAPHRLSLGDLYELTLRPIAPFTNDDRWRLFGSLPPPEHGVKGCIRIEPLTSRDVLVETVWLLTDAAIGRAATNAVILAAPELPDVVLIVHYRGGGFWLESRTETVPVQVDPQFLRLGLPHPLNSHQMLSMGKWQFDLDVDP